MNEISRKYGTYERQSELLSMIRDIDILFRENGVCYSLGFGTLLGAIRENGFIPWDDDIDIIVDRTNYDRIRNIFDKYDGDYRFTSYLWIDRIQRINDHRKGLSATTIDIFVADHCPDNRFLRKMKILMARTLQGMMKKERMYDNQTLPYRLCLWVTHIMGLPFCDEVKYKWYHKISQIGNNRDTEFLSFYTDLFRLIPLRYSSQLFESYEDHAFEDLYLPIITKYDSFLYTVYGDYMTPPDESERVPVHIL